jgi:predicted HicB family RNase H-like nuclease
VARTAARKAEKPAKDSAAGGEKGRMVHIRLDSELHRKLPLVVAAEDTTLQEWITHTLEEAANRAWPKVTKEVGP